MTRAVPAPKLSPAAAEALVRAAGYQPLQPYPGTRSARWICRCTTCGAQRRVRVQKIECGARCHHGQRTIRPATQALQELTEAGFEALTPYPGATNLPWKARCLTCHVVCKPRLFAIRHGFRCRHLRTSPEAAAQEMRDAGYEPQEPYPGYTDVPWRTQCARCGRSYRASLSAVRHKGQRCRCATAGNQQRKTA